MAIPISVPCNTIFHILSSFTGVRQIVAASHNCHPYARADVTYGGDFFSCLRSDLPSDDLFINRRSVGREPGSILDEIVPGFSHVRIVRDDASGRRVFTVLSRFPHPCILALLHTHLTSPSSVLKHSMLRAAQISPPFCTPFVCVSTQKTVAPFEFRAGLENEMTIISNRRNWRFQISIRDQQPSSTNDKINFKHVYTKVDSATGSQFIRHALDDSEPIEELQGNNSAACSHGGGPHVEVETCKGTADRRTLSPPYPGATPKRPPLAHHPLTKYLSRARAPALIRQMVAANRNKTARYLFGFRVMHGPAPMGISPPPPYPSPTPYSSLSRTAGAGALQSSREQLADSSTTSSCVGDEATHPCMRRRNIQEEEKFSRTTEVKQLFTSQTPDAYDCKMASLASHTLKCRSPISARWLPAYLSTSSTANRQGPAKFARGHFSIVYCVNVKEGVGHVAASREIDVRGARDAVKTVTYFEIMTLIGEHCPNMMMFSDTILLACVDSEVRGIGCGFTSGFSSTIVVEGPRWFSVGTTDRFSRGSPVSPRSFISELLHTHHNSSSSALKISMLRAALISIFTSFLIAVGDCKTESSRNSASTFVMRVCLPQGASKSGKRHRNLRTCCKFAQRLISPQKDPRACFASLGRALQWWRSELRREWGLAYLSLHAAPLITLTRVPQLVEEDHPPAILDLRKCFARAVTPQISRRAPIGERYNAILVASNAILLAYVVGIRVVQLAGSTGRSTPVRAHLAMTQTVVTPPPDGHVVCAAIPPPLFHRSRRGGEAGW
ncbi:hypothetical protein PR048_001379 [Dryococelus australis]|uniref:Uncharacterized protein n=1 Tax=Dryococelus australis TaxID=614101 RepID=A0ABQ9IH68_9NEOP|nr:hypothetical protein PR048_001379 [Dryococelus australis]